MSFRNASVVDGNGMRWSGPVKCSYVFGHVDGIAGLGQLMSAFPAASEYGQTFGPASEMFHLLLSTSLKTKVSDSLPKNADHRTGHSGQALADDEARGDNDKATFGPTRIEASDQHRHESASK